MEYIFHTGTEKERKNGIRFLYVFFIYDAFCVAVIFAELRAKLREHLCHHLETHGLALWTNANFNELLILNFFVAWPESAFRSLLTDWLIYWFNELLIDWLNDWLIDWLINWLIGRSIDWSNDRLIDWLIDWLTDWLIDWLIDCLIDRLTDSLKEGWIDRWIDWLFN